MAYLTILLAIVLPLLLIELLVDDWSRDLTTNRAASIHGHRDPQLRPQTVRAKASAVASAVETFCGSSPHWSGGSEKPLPVDSPLPAVLGGEPFATHHLVRSTALIGFKDDVWLVIEDTGKDKIRLHGESRSRVGKGDFGQNPRNLKELMAGLREILEAA